MEQMLINAAGTLAFGGGGIAIVAYIYWKQSETLLRYHKEQIERIAESFEKALDRRDKDFAMLYQIGQGSGVREQRGGRVKNE